MNFLRLKIDKCNIFNSLGRQKSKFMQSLGTGNILAKQIIRARLETPKKTTNICTPFH